MEPDTAKCIFRTGTATIGVCTVVEDMRGMIFYGSFLDNEWPVGATPTAAEATPRGYIHIVITAGVDHVFTHCIVSFGRQDEGELGLCV